MPLSVDNIIQQNTGSFEATSGSASLPAGTTAGSAVLIVVGLGGDNSTNFAVSTPTDFEAAVAVSGARWCKPYLFIRQVSPGSESSWTLAVTGGTQQVLWAAFEVVGLDMAGDLLTGAAGEAGVYLETGVNPFQQSTPSVTSRSTGSTSSSESFDAIGLAIHVAASPDTTVPTLTDHTNGFIEVASVSRTNATRAFAMSVSLKPSQSLGPVECTVTIAPSSQVYAAAVVFTAADAKHAPDIDTCSGFEVGTVTNLSVAGSGATPASPPPWDAVVGTPAVVTSSPRTGNYCLEVSSVAAAECVVWTGTSINNADNLRRAQGAACPLGVFRFHAYFPTALPLTDTVLASIEAGSLANGVVIRFVAASQKIGVKIGSGTEVLSDASPAAAVWFGVDGRYDPRTTTHTLDWQFDPDATPGNATAPVPQTQATASSMTAATISVFRLGWSTSQTATVRYDDIVWGRARKSYPIGDVNVRPLKVDPAGTPTVSGTTANFNTFTSNGTMAAFIAANCRNALDDVPPTIGASSDGLAQITVATNDYVEVPMETYVGAPNHVHRAARWYWAGWAGSANPATCSFHVIDGSLTQSVYGPDDFNFDDTALKWMTTMHRQAGGGFYLLNQAKVDGLAFRWGFSTDANPDVGIHCALVELVTQPVVEYVVTDAEDGAFRAYARQDPFSQSLAGILVATPTGTRGATFYWTLDGVEDSHYVAANSTWESAIGATDVAQVTAYRLEPDPTV